MLHRILDILLVMTIWAFATATFGAVFKIMYRFFMIGWELL